MKASDKKGKRILISYLLIVLSVGVCIVFAGYQYHKNFERHFKANVDNQLSLIAGSKVDEIDHWWEERRDDARIIFGNELFSKTIRLYFKNPGDSLVKNEIKVWMKEFQTGFDYDAVILADLQLRRRIIISNVAESPAVKISTNDIDQLKSGKLVFVDFYESTSKHKVFLKIILPILDNHQLVGLVELRIDPQTYLYSILSHWPTPSESSELYLLRREASDAVYLSELKFQKNTTLKLREPLVQTGELAVQAVLGQEGFRERIDYRGKQVLAYVAKVPNSPWYLVAQTDTDEIYAPLRDDLLQTVIFGFVMFLLSVLGLAFLWKNQRALLYKERSLSVEALSESEERFRSLYEHSTMGIYRTTPEGRIILANDTLVRMLGYDSFEDLRSVELNHKDYEPSYDRRLFIEQIEKNGEIIGLEAVWSRKDGTPVYIRESARAIRDLNQKTLYYDGTVEDISEMKKSELERQVIYEITEGISTTDNLLELLTLIHQSLGKVLYVENIFVSLYDQKTELFSFPYYADQIDTTSEPAKMNKSCSAYVFRTGKPLLITPKVFQQLKEQNEVELVGSPSPSWIGIPLLTRARTLGVLVLQHYEKENVYSERDVRFLDSVGSQIAMAIDRKQAEEDLRNERLLLRTVIDNIPDSIYCKDLALRKTLANNTELCYSGVDSEVDLLGKTDFDLYPGELAEGFLADDQLVIQTGQSVLNREEFIIDRNGEKHWLLTSKLPIKDEFGSITGLVGIGRDITHRRQAEEDLRESEEKYRALIETMIDGVYRSTHEGRFTQVNPAMVRILGYDSKEELQSIDIKSELYFAEEERESAALEEKLEEMAIFRLRRKDGSEIWVEDHGRHILNDKGEVLYHEGNLRDVTERKMAEDEIKRKNEELQRANAEKDKFFSIIAHDLRSPFSGFLGLTQVMAEDLPSLTMAQIQELAVSMKDSATNLYGLLENLLKWSQIQKGSIPFSPEVIQLRTMVEECIAIANAPAQMKGIDLSCSIPESLEILADSNMFQTVIRNLVSNALKFTSRGGVVSVSAQTSGTKRVELAIRDTGIGMSETMISNLFRPDVRTTRKGTDDEPSTGLGLLLCKEFVGKNGGQIRVESQVGEGSVFYLSMPAVET